MKIIRLQRSSGFTLVELLVAMTITVVLLGILVYLTGISMDTYRTSRDKVRVARQAKEAIDAISKDFESMVARRDGNAYEWLYAGPEPKGLEGPTGKEITNASQLIFFTGATDRYNGEIGTASDLGGDVSAVSYRLVYRDQISDPAKTQFPVFSLYRHLVNPDKAFALLAVDDLKAAASAAEFSDAKDLVAENFLVENVYEFTITFLVEYSDISGTTPVTKIERVTLDQSTGGYSLVKLRGNEFFANKGAGQNTDIVNGSIVGVEVSITVLTDQGLDLAKKSGISQEDLLKKHSYHYTKKIITPGS